MLITGINRREITGETSLCLECERLNPIALPGAHRL